jgi:RimJ/RimL family protein N-acetyltransferase
MSPSSPAKRVRIVQLPPEAIAALADGDLDAANRTSPLPLTPIFVDPDWRRTWRHRAVQVVDDPSSLAWITGVIWDTEAEIVVGRAGFHGPPDDAGMVEVGYSVDPVHRRQGYARAALHAMIDRAAADPAVRVVRASVGPWNEPSLGLIGSFGFAKVGEQWDDDDGLEFIFEVPARKQEGRSS